MSINLPINFREKIISREKVPAELFIILDVARRSDNVKNIFLNDFIFPRLVEIKTDNFSLLGKFKKNFIHSAIRDSSADVAI